MKKLSIDIETFSSVNLAKAGVHKYVESPDFEILLFGCAFDDDPVTVVDLASGESLPAEVLDALHDPKVTKHAYNAAFEIACLSGFYDIIPDQWRCTMVHGLYVGYPAGLAAISAALGLPQDKQKASIGSALIKTFCVPCKPTASNGHRTRTLPMHEPEKWELFKGYCAQDVVAEREVEKRLKRFPVPKTEQKRWELDLEINSRGVKVDEVFVRAATYLDRKITEELMDEAKELTGLPNPKSVKQLTEWLETETGQEVPNLQKATVAEMLEGDHSEDAKRALEIRQELAKTSTSKYMAMRLTACKDSRVRGLLQFYGANRSGRWAGRLVQVQNLPRNYLESLNHARICVRDRKLDTLKIIYGNVPDTLSQLIRTAFVPEKGHLFAVADFSAIEARILAWLAKERWVVEVFAGHGKIYEAMASQMFGVPVEKIVRGEPEYELRQKGKVAVLACGYGGGPVALKNMGALNMGLTEEELPEIVHRWRSSNKQIVSFWYDLENAALDTVRTWRPNSVQGIRVARESDIMSGLNFLTITLPSGRKLFYPEPFVAINAKNRDALFYKGVNQNTRKWEDISTFGGKLVENVIQAIARDCLADSLTALAQNGFKTVFHVHDEIVVEIPALDHEAAERALTTVIEVMEQPLPWAPGLILKADGFVTEYYKKD